MTSIPSEGQRICVVGTARTPMGSFGGALASLTAPELGAIAMRAALDRAAVAPSAVDEVYCGNVVSAGVGQAPARQASLAAGVPASVPCTTVNKMCASGAKAIMLGALAIRAGDCDVVLCGGMESMSRAPFYSTSTRFGSKFGDATLVDGLGRDGLRDAYSGEAMGCAAALCAAEEGISREEQDAFAALSYARSVAATKAGKLRPEIVPVPTSVRRKKVLVEDDEEPMQRPVDQASLAKLPVAFALPRSCDGTALAKSPHAASVTAGNASVISDGAAAVVLVSEAFALRSGLKVLAYLDAWADAANDPEHFATAPSKAVCKALGKTGKAVEDYDLWEINEAFSVVTIANARILGVPLDKVNVHGGAVSTGHPIGSSGARLVVTLISALQQTDGARTGCAAICNGGGGASAILLSLPDADLPDADLPAASKL